MKSSQQEEDKAAKAYASISSQLKAWGRDNQEGTRRTASQQRRHQQQQQQQTGTLYFQDDDDDEDLTLNYVSKRESGVFSPLADLQQQQHQQQHRHGDINVNSIPSSTHKAIVQTPSSLGKSRTAFPVSSVGRGYYDTVPVETPMTVGTSRVASNSTATGTATTGSTPFQSLFHTKQNPPQNTTTVPATTNKIMSNQIINRASLDGEYRPYHDALHFLLVQSKMSSHNNIISSKSKSNMIPLQYIRKLSTCAYSRATRLRDELLLLQYEQEEEEKDKREVTFMSSSTKSMVETSIRTLEREGHLISLIGRLAEQSKVVMGNNNKGASSSFSVSTAASATTSTNDVLFYNPPSVSMVEKDVKRVVDNLVKRNENIDLAAMDVYLQDALQCSLVHEEQKQKDDGSLLPTVIKRRQLILDWLQSCHEKTLIGQDWIVSGSVGGSGSSKYGSKSSNIMWKDTLDKFKGDQHSFMASTVGAGMKINEEKVQEYHPDAPLLIVSKHRRKGIVNDAPLYGNDNQREIDLLEKCLLLLKAGKMNRMYDLCREVGQPWRAASWDGDAPHGYVAVAMGGGDEDDGGEGKEVEMDVDGNENGHGNKFALVGNPQRSLWKRNLWEMSQNLHSLIYQNTNEGGGKVVCSGSVLYEAAISAILANNSMIAFQNPLLNKDWMDSLWVFYHGLQARFREIVYHEHNNLTRCMENFIQISNIHPLDGTEYQEEEKEQLQCTSELSRVEESVFISRLAGRSGMKSFGDWDKGITAFLMGMNEAQKYIANSIRFLVDAATNQKKNQEPYDAFLRFVLHLVIFFESLCGEDETVASIFYSNAIAPKRNELVMAYLQQLMIYEPLWEFYNLYASLLPDELLVNVCTEFWSTFVFDEKDRRMLLKSGREYFDQGTDLVILRNVVRASFVPMEESCDPLIVTAWLGHPSHGERYDEELQSMIAHDDIRRMHSIRWMCFYHEHYADAIVCANMLLRSFLLEFCLSNETPENDEFDDWTNSPQVYTAKVFQARFLPENIVQVANQSMTDGEYPLSEDEVDEYISEYQALVQFLDAHSAYEAWKEYISDAPANVELTHDSRFEDNTVESDVAMKVQIMNYVKKKKEIAQGLIKYATAAKDSLMKVLEFENGWLNLSNDDAKTGNKMEDSNNAEQSERRGEIQILRSKCLSTVVSLVFRVCHTTALWMDDFTRDVEATFESDCSDIISRITGYGFFESKGMPNPFQPASWHRMALLMANTVASSETKIAECMSKDELANFMKCMAETNICLLRIQEQNNSSN